jgi:hypothetical protein
MSHWAGIGHFADVEWSYVWCPGNPMSRSSYVWCPGTRVTYGVPGTLLQSVSRTRDQELTCDACLGELGGFAELTLKGRPVEEAYDLVQQHLQVCGECREEFELLLKALECLVEPQP